MIFIDLGEQRADVAGVTPPLHGLFFQPGHCFIHCLFIDPQAVLSPLDEEEFGPAFHFFVKSAGLADSHDLVFRSVDDEQGAGRNFGHPVNGTHPGKVPAPLFQGRRKIRVPDDAHLPCTLDKGLDALIFEKTAKFRRGGTGDHPGNPSVPGGNVDGNGSAAAESQKKDSLRIDVAAGAQEFEAALEVPGPAQDIEISAAPPGAAEIENQDQKT